MIWGRFRAESGGKFNFKFDDLNWVCEGSVAGFVGGAFLRPGGARGPGKALKKVGAKPPAFLKAFPGPRGRPDLKKAPPKIRPDCRQVPSLILTVSTAGYCVCRLRLAPWRGPLVGRAFEAGPGRRCRARRPRKGRARPLVFGRYFGHFGGPREPRDGLGLDKSCRLH